MSPISLLAFHYFHHIFFCRALFFLIFFLRKNILCPKATIFSPFIRLGDDVCDVQISNKYFLSFSSHPSLSLSIFTRNCQNWKFGKCAQVYGNFLKVIIFSYKISLLRSILTFFFFFLSRQLSYFLVSLILYLSPPIHFP